jgi:hypothetical protein
MDLISDFIVIEYEGEWFDEKNSKGTLLYKKGGKYEGEIKNMKRHGLGEYTYPNLDQLHQAKANSPYMILDYKDIFRKSFSGEWNDD